MQSMKGKFKEKIVGGGNGLTVSTNTSLPTEKATKFQTCRPCLCSFPPSSCDQGKQSQFLLRPTKTRLISIESQPKKVVIVVVVVLAVVVLLLVLLFLLLLPMLVTENPFFKFGQN